MLRGREQVWAALTWLCEGARAGQGSALVVRGDPGSGKTWLVRRTAEARRLPVVVLTGVAAEQAEPYAALHRLLTGLPSDEDLPAPQREAVDVVLGRAAGPAPSSLLLAAAVLSLLSASARDRGAVVLVDDAHWVDPASLRVLGFLARRLDGERLGLVLAGRPGPELDALADLPTQELAELDAEDCRSLLPEVRTDVVDALRSHAGGNPLALLESAATLDEGQRRGRSPLPTPSPVTRAGAHFAARLAALDDDARRLAVVLAQGAGEDLDVVLAVHGGGADDTARLLSDLEGARLLTRDATGPAWSHPLARAVALDAASPEQRREVAAALAATLQERGADEAALPHRCVAATSRDEDLARDLERSARGAAARGDHHLAASRWTAAAQHGTGDTAGRLAEAGFAAVRAGRLAQAAQLHEDALAAGAEPELAAGLWLSRGRIAHVDGLPETALHAYQQAVLVAGEDSALALRARAEALFSAMYAGRPEVARDLASAAAERARPGDAVSILFAQHLAGAAACLSGDRPAGADLLRDAVAGSLGHDLVAADPSLVLWWVSASLFAGEPLPPEATDATKAVLEGWRRTGDLTWLPRVLRLWGLTEQLAGRFVASWGALDESVDLSRSAGQRTQLCEALGARAQAHALRGDRSAYERDVAELTALLREVDVPWLAPLPWWTRGVLELSLGEHAEAARVLAPARTLDPRFRDRDAALADLVEALVGAGRQAEAEEVVRSLGEDDSPAACLARGLVEPDGEVALSLLARAQGSDPEQAARAALHLGSRSRRAGRRRAAREQLERALELFEALGATPWIQRTRSELAAAGATLRRPEVAATELTGAESRVALLVAEGRPTKDVAALLFLSPKTVEFHLSRVYRKLGVRGRAELAARLSR